MKIGLAVPISSGSFYAMDDSTAKLWKSYWENGDSDSLNGLMSVYIHLVKDLAEEIIPENLKNMSADFIFAEGLFTMKDCIVAYPYDTPTPFIDYCLPVIKKAMTEELANGPNIQPI